MTNESTTKLKKVCHLTSAHSIDDIRIFHKECISLANNGYDVTLIACGESEYEEIKNGVKCISLNVPVKNRLERMIKRSKAIYKKALEIDADIYHFHDPELFFVGLKLKKIGKKVIFDAHEDFPKQILQKTYIPKFIRKPISMFAGVIDKIIFLKFDLIVTTTPSITSKYKNYGCESVEIRNYPILNNTNIINWNQKKNIICYVGVISELRGVTNLLDALAETKYYLNLAGPFDNKLYESNLRKHKGWDKVIYHGFIPQDEILKIYRESKIGIGLFHSAPNDGISTKLYEYMYAGLPVIISDCTKSNKEIVEKYKCGIVVDPFNKNEIIKAIELLMNNDELAFKMGKNGKKAVENYYNWTNEEHKLLNFYYKIFKKE